MTKPPPPRRSSSGRNVSFNATSYPGLDYSLLGAAGRIIEGSLGAVSGERVAILVGREREGLGAALATAVHAVGAVERMIVIDSLGPRPQSGLAYAALEALAWAHASVFAADARPEEQRMRDALIEAVEKHGLRHAHLVGVSVASLLSGLAVDPSRIAAAARAVRGRARPASTFRVKSSAGTDLIVKCDPSCRFSEHSGVIRSGRWESLPTGALVTCPADVSGVYVATASFGSSYGIGRGSLRHRPVKLSFENGAVRKIEAQEEALAQEFRRRIRDAPNADRVGLLRIGTNLGVSEPSGDIVADRTLPGAHLDLGRTLPEETAARWSSDAWLGVAAEGTDVDLDDVPLIRKGRFVVL